MTILKILMVEDVLADAELIERDLRRGGLDFEAVRVASREAYEERLDGGVDLILCDFRLPDFDGAEALGLARERIPDVPFIFVTGTMGDDRAVEMLKQGATDYVLKDNLARLVPSVLRAMDEARERLERRAATAALRAERAILGGVAAAVRFLLEEASWEQAIDRTLESLGRGAGVSRARLLRLDPEAKTLSVTNEWADEGMATRTETPALVDVPLSEVGLGRWYDVLGSGRSMSGRAESFPEGERWILEDQHILSVVLVPISVEGRPWGAIGFDQCDHPRIWQTSEIHALEVAAGVVEAAATRRADEELLRERETRYRTLAESIPDTVIRYDRELRVTHINRTMSGRPVEEVVGRRLAELGLSPEEVAEIERRLTATLADGMPRTFELDLPMVDGHTVEVRVVAEMDEDGSIRSLLSIERDVTQLHETKRRLLQTVERMSALDSQRRALLRALTDAQEEERRKLADELHDETLQGLAALALRLEALRVEPDPRTAVSQVQADVSNAIARLWMTIADLRPPALDGRGLAAATKDLVSELQTHHGLDVVLDEALESEPAPGTRLLLYRVVQESLTNVRKHAHATHGVVALRETDDAYIATISDDGRGFDVDKEIASTLPGHIGIAHLKERVELSGGSFACASNPDKGTVVEVWLPKDEHEDRAA
ncbi:MAG: response regulator [Actinomycetota bacterium]